MTNLIDGVSLARKIKRSIKKEVNQLINNGKRVPHLVTVLVGDNPASVTYVNGKLKDCYSVGFHSSLLELPITIKEGDLLSEIENLNNNPNVDGFIIQLPLPKAIDQEKVILAIDPNKDVDGFHPLNIGKLALGLDTFISATPYGILKIFEEYNISVQSKNVTIIGRSRIVGIPMSLLLNQKSNLGNMNLGNATVTLCNSHTKNLQYYTKNADIIIAALGIPYFLKADMIKEGAIVIDVGISRVEDSSSKSYHLVGDVDFEHVKEKCQWITPVPGGVGPLTRAMLLKNTLQAYKNRMKNNN